MRTYNNNQVSLAEIAAKVGVTEEALRSHSHNQKEVDARSMAVAMMMCQPRTRQSDVANTLGVTQVAISKLLARHRRMVQYHPPYRRRWEEINAAGNQDVQPNKERSIK